MFRRHFESISELMVQYIWVEVHQIILEARHSLPEQTGPLIQLCIWDSTFTTVTQEQTYGALP